MMDTQNYWDESSTHSMQVKYESSLEGRSCKDEIYRMGIGAGYCEGNLNFTTASEDDEVYTKKKVSRQDPMSHRIIEKRRRDRMNNCLADLSRLIPTEYLKKGRGRVEKTEIIEMAIRHMKYLQGAHQDTKHPSVTNIHNHQEDSVDSVSHSASGSIAAEHYRMGFQECLSEAVHFLVEGEGFFARDSLCVQLINHLQQHCEKIVATSDRLGFPHPEMPTLNDTGASSFVDASIPTLCPPTNHSDRGSSSGISSLSDSERPQQIIPPPTMASDDSNHSSHSNNASSSVPRPSNYKFKSSIKQRFSAERIKSSPLAPSEKSHGVPIFALHEGGAFYIPLTIDSGFIRPQMSYITDTGPDIVLHPVTISVNFNQASNPTWSPQYSPRHQDHL
ncbi:Similar to cwo: Transcription factor cwo (Drosophila melanogaster) [Cotesia congregata]|uniref:Similar to cwo: Transcription factor cwo (Drosophila melanogaster) n=1 Tax=Cotesia congregata TaxID=51543 RepID=A0A8J2HLB6_COTCN|nr:Similar to cwo: Transcription factor cwo (Drosophila melanogaster) [Cotesia congregata]